MRLTIILFFIIVTTSSCHFFEPRDTSYDTPIKSLTQLNNLTGSWKATAETYELLKQRKYKVDSMSLVFRNDSTFVITNLPDCINDGFGESIDGKLYKVAGKWSVQKNKRDWEIEMAFDKNELFQAKTYMNFDIAITDSIYQLYWYLGDPDDAEPITFEKPI
ncbi:hypothetical protein FC093_23295 [Ilyomonas limi]|uniref:Lipocalin-like domain-containing protein n=1 Tax=Ilyomonas limi TaxID=2575867 RepID=A0A4U3KPE6_9BACT|nr:hypothetical protein [Ilyomonas limi]TKK64115.1 hypothetical protein FC093_23295 [Ilyomonas limi]